MEQVALDVPDLDSREDERETTTALISVPGVEWATAAANSGTVAARYDPRQTDLDALCEAIEASGYRASIPTPE